MANDLVCIDSMICIWGIKKIATEEQQHMIPQTEAFIDWLDTGGKRIFLPSPIITEIIAPVSDEKEKSKILKTISDNFIVGPLDTLAATKAGEIWNARGDWKEIYQEGSDTHKKRFKFDLLILGIAITRKVSIFYTNDIKLKTIASQYVKCENMPLLPIQGELF